MKSKILRLIDANVNRLREALRVAEDIARFILSDKKATRRLKLLRHRAYSNIKAFECSRKALSKFRLPERDIGRASIKSELKRSGIEDIFRANMKRAEESVRVLEEFSKLLKPPLSGRFKVMRFELYAIEKIIAKKLQALRHHR